MNHNSQDHDALALLVTLADPTRLKLIDALRNGERSVGDLTGTVEIAQSGVSRHLQILAEAGFLSVRPDAQRRFYRLRAEPFAALSLWCQSITQAVL